MHKTLTTIILLLAAACIASSQTLLIGPVKSPKTADRYSYGFDAGHGRTLKLDLDTRMASYGNMERATVALSLEGTRNGLYRKGVIDTRTLLPVTATTKDTRKQTIYDWNDSDSLTRYVFDISDRDGQSCQITRHESRYAIDVCNVLYRMYTLQNESSFCGLAVIDGGKLRDITKAIITRTADSYTYKVLMSHGYHITATFLNDRFHTPVSIDIHLKDFRSSGMRVKRGRERRDQNGILARKTFSND